MNEPQSIDRLQSSMSLTVQDHLRLRGGGGAAQKKSDGSATKGLKSTTADEAKLEPDTDLPSPLGRSPSKAEKSKKSPVVPCNFAVNDRIEVITSGH